MLRKFLLGCGVLFLLGFVSCGAFGVKSYMWKQEAEAYAQQALKDIASEWTRSALTAEIAEKALEATPPSVLRELVEMGRNDLGVFLSLSIENWRTNANLEEGGLVISVEMRGVAEFRQSDAVLSANCVRKQGVWKFYGFHLHRILPDDADQVPTKSI